MRNGHFGRLVVLVAADERMQELRSCLVRQLERQRHTDQFHQTNNIILLLPLLRFKANFCRTERTLRAHRQAKTLLTPSLLPMLQPALDRALEEEQA